EAEFMAAGRDKPQWGARRAIVNELSPAASAIAAGYNLNFSLQEFTATAESILDEAKSLYGSLYSVVDEQGDNADFAFLVWSEVFSCDSCSTENVFFDNAFDPKTGKVNAKFACSGCGSVQSKEDMSLIFETKMSRTGRGSIRSPRLVPVLLKYSQGR